MIAHDSFWSAVFPENRRARLKLPPKVPRESQLQLQKFVFIFKMIIMAKKILKTKITERGYLPKETSRISACVARVWKTYACGTGACVCVAFVCARVCVQDMTRAHITLKCQEKNGTLHIC